jgi:hypothetical protein
MPAAAERLSLDMRCVSSGVSRAKCLPQRRRSAALSVEPGDDRVTEVVEHFKQGRWAHRSTCSESLGDVNGADCNAKNILDQRSMVPSAP